MGMGDSALCHRYRRVLGIDRLLRCPVAGRGLGNPHRLCIELGLCHGVPGRRIAVSGQRADDLDAGALRTAGCRHRGSVCFSHGRALVGRLHPFYRLLGARGRLPAIDNRSPHCCFFGNSTNWKNTAGFPPLKNRFSVSDGLLVLHRWCRHHHPHGGRLRPWPSVFRPTTSS